MNVKNNKSGFTLLEIIIVIIIVGVLASLALPRFFETVEYSRSTEALAYMGAIKRGLETCALGSGVEDWQVCDTVEEAGLNPTPDSGHFAYEVDVDDVTAATSGEIKIIAERTARAGGTTTDTITFTLDVANGNLQRAGTTAFAAIK